MDIFGFSIGNSWKEYNTICFEYHMSPFLTRIIILFFQHSLVGIPNLRQSFGLLYKSIFMLYGEDGTNKKLASLNIVAKCLDNVSKLYRSTNILYFHRFSDPHPLYLFDFLMSKSPTSYNASWWRRNDLLFYLILACMWCIKLIMQEK